MILTPPLRNALANDHLQVHCTNILMRTSDDKARVARTALDLAWLTRCGAQRRGE